MGNEERTTAGRNCRFRGAASQISNANPALSSQFQHSLKYPAIETINMISAAAQARLKVASKRMKFKRRLFMKTTTNARIYNTINSTWYYKMTGKRSQQKVAYPLDFVVANSRSPQHLPDIRAPIEWHHSLELPDARWDREPASFLCGKVSAFLHDGIAVLLSLCMDLV